MPSDEQQIRDVIRAWSEATWEGDLPRVLALMADDVVFLVAGQAPMRRADFAAAFEGVNGRLRIESSSEVQELVVVGDLAYCWNQLSVEMTVLATGQVVRRRGPTLTVFRKVNGAWLLARDANLLVLEAAS
jgi:uncharacterized protein (TIGR02246 family)